MTVLAAFFKLSEIAVFFLVILMPRICVSLSDFPLEVISYVVTTDQLRELKKMILIGSSCISKRMS